MGESWEEWRLMRSRDTGGKAKPLKAPKKAPKGEEDDDDKAFKEKQKAGTLILCSG